MNFGIIGIAVGEILLFFGLFSIAKFDKKFWLKPITELQGEEMRGRELTYAYLIQSFWELLIFNIGILVGIAVMIYG